MKVIYIVGGDSFARECYNALVVQYRYDKEFIFGGFLGHAGYGHTVDYKSYQHLYKGELSEHIFGDNDHFIVGAAYPCLRKKIYADLKHLNAKFFNFVTEDSFVPPSVKLGESNVILSSLFTVNIEIGSNNVMNGQVIVGHDCVIGNSNFFGVRSEVLGNVKIGNENQIGVNSIFLPKSKIGNNNKIAPLSVIYKGCRDNCYMQGNPALKVGEVE